MKMSKLMATCCVAAYFTTLATAHAETLAALAGRTHFHGISFARSGSAELLLATHHGIFAVDAKGEVQQVSPIHDYMGFSPDPANPLSYYASGHPASGGNSGFLKSVDGGATWTMVSAGANGPVDFHAMTVSSADPKTVYGLFNGIQVSRDAGNSWEIAGPAPAELIALAASSADANTLYAATLGGLLMSSDSGKTWQAEAFQGQQVSLVETTHSGQMMAFVLGQGLMTAKENDPQSWRKVSNVLGEAIPLHLAFDPEDNKHMVVTTQANIVLESRDGGTTFSTFGAAPQSQ